MARKVVLTQQALSHLEALSTYIAKDSAHYAALTIAKILRRVESLQEFPESGRIVPEFEDPKLRELLWGTYRIVYRLKPELVEVLAVVHGKRQLERAVVLGA